MVRAFAIIAVLVTGCFDDTYHCTTDEQCDVGEGGRCEIDGLCTHFDATCPTLRRYSDHAGVQTAACFDDRAEPINACAGGQGPALPTGCFADVCARVPACCNVGWTDVCAQIAQEACPSLKCDTRIAVNATGAQVSRFVLIWDGTTWTIAPRNNVGGPLQWIGPAPGDGGPRLAYPSVADPAELMIGDVPLPVPADHGYFAFSSIGFDRDGRDTIAAAWEGGSLNGGIDVWKLPAQTVRTVAAVNSNLGGFAWGDLNRDGFPDPIMGSNTGGTYTFFNNQEGPGHVRELQTQAVSNVTGGATTGALAIRATDWLDFNGDGVLDLAVFGSSIRIHTRPEGLNDQVQFDLDCDPPSTARSCMADPQPDLEQTAFVGAAFPTVSGPSFVAGIFPDRKLYRVQQQAGGAVATQLAFTNDTCACAKTCSAPQCPGPNCTCTYDCNSCPSVLAIVSRDLDADHQLDIIAIDAKLRIYVALAKDGFVFGSPTPIVTPLPAVHSSVDVSVSGALIP